MVEENMTPRAFQNFGNNRELEDTSLPDTLYNKLESLKIT